jgi:hypothetical protein
LRILSAVKKLWGRRITTVFVRQGHYALDPEVIRKYPPADLTIERIGDLLLHPLEAFLPATTKRASQARNPRQRVKAHQR